jgi:Domain of Unknown Function (DUF1080)
MKKLILLAITGMAIACGDNPATTGEESKTDTATTTVPANTEAMNNTLSSEESAAGWKLLFDGNSLNGWRTYQNKKSDSWSVQDGVLHCKGSETDKSDLRSDLITNDQFENFELSLDWKIAPKGNSGLMYMVTEGSKAAYMTGPEYQLIDDIGFPEKLEDWQKTGANYAMEAAPEATPNAVGSWNNTRVIVNRGHVEHWLNGKKVVEYELWSDKWKADKAKGKWKDTPEYGMSKKGHIALQDHGSEAWFKNIKIKGL